MSNMKIQLVEDEIITALILESECIDAGYTIVGPVAHGEKAIELACQEKPDVILMDINLLGEMDGIEAAKQICALIETTIIFITGYDDKQMYERALAVKPLAYLIKPVDFYQIQEYLTKLST